MRRIVAWLVPGTLLAGALVLGPAALAGAIPALDVSVTSVQCPASIVRVNTTNRSSTGVTYTLYADGEFVAREQLRAGETNTDIVEVPRGRTITIKVINDDRVVYSTSRKGCGKRKPRPGPLPHTGPPTDLFAKLATAGGLLVGGLVLWWYGAIWPRDSISLPPGSARSRYGATRSR